MNHADVQETGQNPVGAIVDWADSEGCITGDFVHYVIHVAANACGERCEVCADEAGRTSGVVS